MQATGTLPTPPNTLEYEEETHIFHERRTTINRPGNNTYTFVDGMSKQQRQNYYCDHLERSLAEHLAQYDLTADGHVYKEPSL